MHHLSNPPTPASVPQFHLFPSPFLISLFFPNSIKECLTNQIKSTPIYHHKGSNFEFIYLFHHLLAQLLLFDFLSQSPSRFLNLFSSLPRSLSPFPFIFLSLSLFYFFSFFLFTTILYIYTSSQSQLSILTLIPTVHLVEFPNLLPKPYNLSQPQRATDRGVMKVPKQTFAQIKEDSPVQKLQQP